jgi:hypothetical protein
MLAQTQGDGEESHQESRRRSSQHSRQDAQPETAAEVCSGETGHRPEKHDPFDAEVEDSTTFSEHLAQCRENEGRRDSQDGGEKADLEDLPEDFHQRCTRKRY